MPTPEVKVCEDCLYSRGRTGRRFCAGPQRERFNLVDGRYIKEATCEYERASLWRTFGANTCGPEGRFWQHVSYPSPPPPADGD